jgi:hypothetical protein
MHATFSLIVDIEAPGMESPGTTDQVAAVLCMQQHNGPGVALRIPPLCSLGLVMILEPRAEVDGFRVKAI